MLKNLIEKQNNTTVLGELKNIIEKSYQEENVLPLTHTYIIADFPGLLQAFQ